MFERRFPWYLLSGLIVGLALGLGVTWGLAPNEQPVVDPASLRTDYKDEYRALIAVAFVANGDFGRARARLAILGEEDPAEILASQAQRTLAQGGSAEVVRALGLLANAFDAEPTPVSQAAPAALPEDTPVSESETAETSIPTPDEPEETSTPEPSTPTPTFLPTRTATLTPGAVYEVQNFQPLCNPDIAKPLIQVFAFDAAQQPVPGVEVVVTWEGGEDHFFTGLKPEFGLGYADFEMTPGELYTVRLTDGGEPLTGISAPDCETSSGERFWGSWQVAFTQP